MSNNSFGIVKLRLQQVVHKHVARNIIFIKADLCEHSGLVETRCDVSDIGLDCPVEMQFANLIGVVGPTENVTIDLAIEVVGSCDVLLSAESDVVRGHSIIRSD